MMRLHRLLVPLMCALTLAAGAPAVAAERSATSAGAADVPATQLDAIRRLDFMVGKWAGSGWVDTATGRQEFLQTEKVAYKAGGQVLTVEGEGRDKADPRRIVDTALAVVSYSDATGQYRWEAFSQGHVTESVPVVGDHTFQWSLQTGGPTIRYTLSFTGRTWHEVGEYTLDGGATWRQNFQMDLRRVA
ncbi:hypothetical protein [Microbispora rosea]|uniref:DUF1579 domain-containing protein n=1 Tax=Microbispora rosea TaxID=58117 RepID=A0A1N7GY42_9ACTN|nr:hypothetical protein [Microbispora rosea]GIH47884.1 hypothetical protein Mro03_30630 [Microbispora rosea subsp. rosea]SIS17499.1 hypothetical protein SAMN05421833_13416 [Microbispora rosea]